VLAILQEDSEEDDEVLSLTNRGVLGNRNPSFTNLMAEAEQEPEAKLEGREAGEARGVFYLQDGEDVAEDTEKEDLYSSSFDEDVSDEVYRTVTSQRLLEQARATTNPLHKAVSAGSLASSASSAEFQSFHTSPTSELDQQCTIG
jgi:hypothetical protein